MTWKAELDPSDHRLLALYDRWAAEGLLRGGDRGRADVVEDLHATEFFSAWQLTMASLSDGGSISDSDREEATALLTADGSWDVLDLPAQEYVRQVLAWTVDPTGPFPQVT